MASPFSRRKLVFIQPLLSFPSDGTFHVSTSDKAGGWTEVERLKPCSPAGDGHAFGNGYRFCPCLLQSARGLAQSKTLRVFPSTKLRASILDCASLLALLHGSEEHSCRQTSISGTVNLRESSSIAGGFSQ